jgi:tyrosyl-tRNA synthetase
MSAFKSEFLHTLSTRGFIHQTSDDAGLDALFAKETVSAYIGFDPTASSLHAGSLLQIMMLHWMQKTGHRAVALMGGGTGMVGDPSFKDEARKLMTPEIIQSNIDSLKKVFANYLSFGEGPKDALMVNNA